MASRMLKGDLKSDNTAEEIDEAERGPIGGLVDAVRRRAIIDFRCGLSSHLILSYFSTKYC